MKAKEKREKEKDMRTGNGDKEHEEIEEEDECDSDDSSALRPSSPGELFLYVSYAFVRKYRPHVSSVLRKL